MHRWGWIAVICALAITACSGNTSNGAVAPTTADPTSVDTAAVTSPAATEAAATTNAETSTAAAPAGVTAADGSPMSAAQFSTVADAVLRPEGFTPASPPVDVVVPDGLVSAPVRLSLPGSAPPDGALPLLLHRNELGWWEAVPAEYVSGSYTADVVSFSWYWPGWAATTADWISTTAGTAVDAAGNVIDAGLDWVSGRTDPPQPCGSNPYPWVSSSGSPPDGAFHVCLEQNPRGATERVEVKIKSNRAFAMWVVIPRAGADYVWVEGSSWDAIGPTMLAFTGGAGDRVLLGAGRTVTVGYTRPTSAPASYRFYAYQDNLTQIMSLLTRNAGDANAALGTLLAVISCFDEGMSSIADLSWDRAWECLNGLLGATANQVELALDRAISSGRVALSAADREAFGAAVLRSNRLSSTLAAFKKVAAVLSLARLAADAVVLANDAAIGLVDGAGELTVSLDAAAAPGSDDGYYIVCPDIPDFNSAGDDAVNVQSHAADCEYVDQLIRDLGAQRDWRNDDHSLDVIDGVSCIVIEDSVSDRHGPWWGCEGGGYVINFDIRAASSGTLIPEPLTGPLFLGHQGFRVAGLQRMLQVVGKLSAIPDGEFGHGTESAVMAFQRDANLVADGLAGPATMHALDVAAGGAGYPTMRDANQAVLTLLNTGGGVPTTGWLAQDLTAMNFPGFTWSSNTVGATELTFTEGSDDGGGVYSILSVAFEQHDGLFWYAGITLQEGH